MERKRGAGGANESRDIYVLGEVSDGGKPTALTLELAGLGRELAGQLGAGLHVMLMGDEVEEAGEELAQCGLDVLVFNNEGYSVYNPDLYLAALADFFRERTPGLVLFGHTAIGSDLAPRLAFSLGAGLSTDCVGVKAEGGELLFTQPVYGGNALATRRVRTEVALATVRARVGEAPVGGDGASIARGKVTDLEVEIAGEARMKSLAREKQPSRECPLEEAPVVVAGGRGMGGGEGFEALRELASLFGGAVGASRPPVDAGWAPTTCQVGITGKVVAPDLYIAVAISGSSQHLSGMSDAAKIVAVNRDPDAFIFSVSDYGVVGDWRQVLPAFVSRLRELLAERGGA